MTGGRSKPAADALRLVLLGAGPRLALASGLAGALWLGFLWAVG